MPSGRIIFYSSLLCFILAISYKSLDLFGFTSTSPMSTPTSPPEFITVPSTGQHTATIIFVHGLGDSGYGWRHVAEDFRTDPAFSHMKWILPHAPTRKVTVNGGREMRAWFDVKGFGSMIEDEAGLLESRQSLNDLIANEISLGTPPDRIVLGGFSQGGAMSLLTGLTTEKKLAGVVALSARLPLKDKIQSMASSYVKSLPIFWGHGTSDPVLKFELGLSGAAALKSDLGISPISVPIPASATKSDLEGLAFHSYEGMGHSTCEKEIDDLRQWLVKVLPK